jgi:hypothetical protein
MVKIIFGLLMLMNIQDAFASHVVGKKINVTCHNCRISSKRQRSADTKYLPCPNAKCAQAFCTNCIGRINKTGEKLLFDKSCIHCSKQCCCNFERCELEHRHCHTYNRTQKRHESSGRKLKWKKRKAPLKRKCEESATSQVQPKKLKQEIKIKRELFSSDSTSEEVQENPTEILTMPEVVNHPDIYDNEAKPEVKECLSEIIRKQNAINIIPINSDNYSWLSHFMK